MRHEIKNYNRNRYFTVATVVIVSADYLLTLVSLFYQVNTQCQSSPPEAQHATHNVTGSPPFSNGLSASYQCGANYNRVGGGSVSTCTGTTWSSVTLQCAIKECPAVNAPKNGRISNSPSYTVATTIEFECNAGHNLIGSRSLLCRVDEQWSPSTPPTCDPVDCGDFVPITNAEAPFQDTVSVEENHYGATVRVRCLTGFVLNGNAQVTCQANGQWSVKPTCDVSACPPYPGLQSKCVKNTELFGGTVLYMTCVDGITRTGATSADCENNNWVGVMACYCNCSLNAALNSSVLTVTGLNSDGSLTHNVVLTSSQWTCLGGYTKNFTETVTCVDGALMMNGVALNITGGDLANVCVPATTTPSIEATTDEPTTNRTVEEQTTTSNASRNFPTTKKQMPTAGSNRHSSIPVLIMTICLTFVAEL